MDTFTVARLATRPLRWASRVAMNPGKAARSTSSRSCSMPLTRSLQEVVLAVHFVEPLPFNIVDVAAWVSVFGGANPTFVQLPLAPPFQLPTPGALINPVTVQLVGETAAIPRVRLQGPDKHTVHVLQNDRVAFGWHRDVEVGVEADYPGYDGLRGRWAEEIERFVDWLQTRVALTPSPRVVELSYNNAYRLEIDGHRRKISDILRVVDPDRRPANAFNLAWSEFLDSPEQGVVSAQAGLGHAPPGHAVLALNYLGFAPSPQPWVGSLSSAILDASDKLHDRILEIHRAAVFAEA